MASPNENVVIGGEREDTSDTGREYQHSVDREQQHHVKSAHCLASNERGSYRDEREERTQGEQRSETAANVVGVGCHVWHVFPCV
jgi:hypothetical protein